MLRIGITGGIGSGKTTVCQVFEELGIAVYYADAETKKLYASNTELKQKLIDEFGEKTYENGQFNRNYIAEIVFNNPEKLAAINAIVHPFVFAHYEDWCSKHMDEKYTLKEAAILFESGSYKLLNFIIAVVAPEKDRVQRIIARDGLSADEIQRRIQNQMPQDELLKRADFVIENDGIKSIIEQVINLHQKLNTLS